MRLFFPFFFTILVQPSEDVATKASLRLFWQSKEASLWESEDVGSWVHFMALVEELLLSSSLIAEKTWIFWPPSHDF